MNRFSLVNVAYADVGDLVKRVNRIIINPIIVLMFFVATAYFVYGVLQFLMNADNEDARSTGRQHMIWGVVGMFIMMSVFGIMQILINTFGVTGINPRG